MRSKVGRVDRLSNNTLLAPPTPVELAKLAAMARKLQITEVPNQTPQPTSRSLHRRLSPKEIRALAKRYEAGETISALNRELEISPQALRNILKMKAYHPAREA